MAQIFSCAGFFILGFAAHWAVALAIVCLYVSHHVGDHVEEEYDDIRVQEGAAERSGREEMEMPVVREEVRST